MAPPTAFERDEFDRTAIQDEIALVEAAIAEHAITALTERETDTYLEKAAEIQVSLSENMKSMRHHSAKGTDLTQQSTEYTRMFCQASRLHATLHGIKMTFPVVSTPPPVVSTAAPTGVKQQVKLPPLELPKFSGNLQEWVSFRDLFVTTIHNSTLTKVEKMTQLKSLLTGEAARQIRSMALSEANYDTAWKILQNRYDNEREQLISVLRRLHTQPAITTASATSMRNLIDTTMECVRSLEILGQKTEHCGSFIFYVLHSKMDSASRVLWEQGLKDTKIPDLSILYEFLEQRSRALAADATHPIRQQMKQQQPNHVRAHHTDTSRCPLGCSKSHFLIYCQEFQKLTPQQRHIEAKRLNRCLNCLASGHQASNCRSNHTCKTCKRKHHTMIHITPEGGNQHPESHTSTPQSHHLYTNESIRTGLLATALIKIHSSIGGNLRRTLLDNGSTNSFITEKAAKAMRLRLHPVHIPVSGLQEASCGQVKHVTTFIVSPHFQSSFSFTVTALVVNKISSLIPAEKIRKDDWCHLQGLVLADPEFHVPEPVDVLLGTEHFWSLLDNEKIPGEDGQPLAWKSSLGWLVAGPNNTSTPVSVFNTNVDLSFQLTRFWEQETIYDDDKMSKEEKNCEEHFAIHHTRDSQGRFTVALPLKTDEVQLGDSYSQAKRRFLSLENKFLRNKKIQDENTGRKLKSQWTDYQSFMKEYEDLGHMSLVPPEEKKAS